MWVNPKYKDQVQQPTPPQEQGRRLATFPRGDGAELRISLAEYQGGPYVALRVWERDQAGAWWPVKGKGCSVRIAEAGKLAEALTAVAGVSDRTTDGAGQGAAMTEHHAGEQQAPKFIDKGRPIRPPWDTQKLKPSRPAVGPGEFDEFAE